MSHLITVNLSSTVFDEKRVESGQGGHRWWKASLSALVQEDSDGTEYIGAPFESWGETQGEALDQLVRRLEQTLDQVRKLREEIKGA